MHDGLVKRLREDAEDGYLIQTKIGDDIAEAADAIEEMQKLLDGVCADNDSLCEKIAELSKTLESVQDAHNEGYDVGYWAGRRDYEPKWIPVTERLPLEAGDYITMTNAIGKNKGVIAQKFVKTTARGKPVERWEWYGRISPWTVTHWMQLPEPPKEE